jgi:signal transduction histidine kinase
MHRVEITPAEAATLVERLADVEGLRSAPRAEREWMVAHGELRRYDQGEIMVRKSEAATEMVVLLTGRVAVYFDHGAGRRHLLESRAGTVSGVLPYSRLGRPPGDVVVQEPLEVLAIHRDQLQGLTRECPTITTELVHNMLDRARSAVATDWQDEKMVSLGRLAAGIAHELNNPASAAVRLANLLGEALSDVGEAARAFGALGLTEEQGARVEKIIRDGRDRATEGALAPLERADREEAMAEWLASRGADARYAVPLAERGVALDMLFELAAALPRSGLNAALGWLAAASTAQSLASDVERATTRIYELVSAVKRFTFMDRAGVPAPTDIAQGLADTVAVLASKARQKSVAVRLDVAQGLPLVLASVAELNQVWSNLLDNALDAVGPSGEVTVSAATDGDVVVVRVIDNGPGIPADVLGRIFDPFFTTKPVGEGVGLGLEIARRIVRTIEGQIYVKAEPGRTEFRVHLPAARP